MSRALIYGFIGLALTGCIGNGTVEMVDQTSPVEVVAFTSLQAWMNMQEEVARLSTAQTEEQLAELGEPADPGQKFHFALLNQQLKTLNGWVLARDTLRDLQQEETLSSEQRQLAGILEMYNQNRINWYEVYTELLTDYELQQKQLQATREEKVLLENKIKELTEIEAVISNRAEE
jgi:hypothetical protein